MAKYTFHSIIFDLDGVLTKTAHIHAQAWKEVFDDYLRLREKRNGEPFREFTLAGDYLPYVDGIPRYQGVASFLKSRGIKIPYGQLSDAPDQETICGLGNKKNLLYQKLLKKEGAQVFPSTVAFIRKLKKANVQVGVASSSKNCKLILESVGLEDLFATRVDGVVAQKLGLKGKPEGDIFVRAANNLGAEPGNSVIVEDATSGVEAGRNGGFGLVLGVARENNEAELLASGADMVVRDLAEITLGWIEKWFKRRPQPLFKSWDKRASSEFKSGANNIQLHPAYMRSSRDALFRKRRIVFFLDYDGTLTPIVKRPQEALLSKEMQDVLRQLSARHTVAIVSGRRRQDVEGLVGIKGIYYAGSHGFDIAGCGISLVLPPATRAVPLIRQISQRLDKELKDIPGLLVEKKRFTVAVHFRLVEKRHLPRIERLVEAIVRRNKSLRLMRGKKVLEILPNINWDKGQAIRWLMQVLKISWKDSTVVYIGDDTTDEYAFRMVRTRGIPILVAERPKISAADFQLFSPDEVKKLFAKVIKLSS